MISFERLINSTCKLFFSRRHRVGSGMGKEVPSFLPFLFPRTVKLMRVG